MKAYAITLLVVDLDGAGSDKIEAVLEDTRYRGPFLAPRVVMTETRDIGEWGDDHPLNHVNKWKAEYKRLFIDKPQPPKGRRVPTGDFRCATCGSAYNCTTVKRSYSDDIDSQADGTK